MAKSTPKTEKPRVEEREMKAQITNILTNRENGEIIVVVEVNDSGHVWQKSYKYERTSKVSFEEVQKLVEKDVKKDMEVEGAGSELLAHINDEFNFTVKTNARK